MPSSAFKQFTKTVSVEQRELALQLYHKCKSKFDFCVTYAERYQVWDEVFDGDSAIFTYPGRDDFFLRMDIVKSENSSAWCLRLALPNCAKYMNIIEIMPEYIQQSFRYDDCKCCRQGCDVTMVYTLEGVDYRQCHFIALGLTSAEDMENIFSLLCAEQEAQMRA